MDRRMETSPGVASSCLITNRGFGDGSQNSAALLLVSKLLRGITACGPGGGSHQPRCCISATTGTLRLPLESTRMPWISRYLRTQPLIPRLRDWTRCCAAASLTALGLRQEHKRDMMAPWDTYSSCFGHENLAFASSV